MPALQKSQIRTQLRARLEAMGDEVRHSKSVSACANVMATSEFRQARVVMLYLSIREEVDTAPLALRCWQEGKAVLVPQVSWDQRRMLPVEIHSLQTAFTTTGPGVREPVDGKPYPVNTIDLAIVPGLGFTLEGYRIGRGMGFYDRFLAQDDFIGISCGLAFDEQVVPELPILDHDVPLRMLATEAGVWHFANRRVRS